MLSVWDDDSGNILGIGHADDLVDYIQHNVAMNVPAQKDFQSSDARSITVRRLPYVQCWLVII